MKARRCGFGVPLEQLDPQARQAIEDFKRYLTSEVALAADGLTYVPLDSPDAAHVVERPGMVRRD